MSDGFEGALRIRLFFASQNVHPGFCRMHEHPFRIRTSTLFGVFLFFHYSSESGTSFLPHALQYFEWMPFSARQCLQIYILFNEIVLIKWETI